MRRGLPRSFIRLVVGQGASLLGDSFRFLTLMLWVYDTGDGSTVQLSLAVLAQLLPQVILGPVAGAITDRLDNIKALIGADLLRFGLGIVLLLCAVTGNVPVALITVAFASAVSAVSQPAIRSAVHTLVSAGSLARVNTIIKVIEQSTFLIGPAAAAISYSRWGAPVALAADAASYLVAAAAVRGMRAAPAGPVRPTSVRLINATGEGLRYVMRHQTLRIALIVSLGMGVTAGVYQTIMIPFIAEDLHEAPGWVGALTVTNGILQVAVGGLIIGLARGMRTGRTLMLACAITASGAIAVTASQNLPMLVAAIAVLAVGNMPYNVALTGLQQTVPDREFRGRVVGIFESTEGAVFVVCSLAAGIAAQALPARVMFGVAAGVVVLAATLSFRLRSVRTERINGEQGQ